MPEQQRGQNNQYVVVVVDDDPAVCSSLKFSFELEGFPVQTYASAETTLAAADLPTCGCIIVDYRLPQMNGLELIRKVRARGVGLPAILITSHPTQWLRDAATTQGVAIVEKPLLNDHLLDSIHRLRQVSSANLR